MPKQSGAETLAMRNKIYMTVHPVEAGQIVEIDSEAELAQVDPDYRRWNLK